MGGKDRIWLNTTGALNTTIVLGGEQCPKCGCRATTTDDFHGHLVTLCMACGTERRYPLAARE